MDENGDAPEHPFMRWLDKLKGYDRTAFHFATWLVLFGALFTSAGWSIGSLFQCTLFDFLDKLGWSLMQLGGAVYIVNYLLAKARSKVFKPLIEEAQFDLKQLTQTALNPRFLIGPLQQLGKEEPMNVLKLDHRRRTRRAIIQSNRRDTILRASVAVQHDQGTLDLASAIINAIKAEDLAARYLISAAYDPAYCQELPEKLHALREAYQELNTFDHFANHIEVQAVIDAIPPAIARLTPSSTDPTAP